MTQTEQTMAAAQFVKDWTGRGNEKSETHNFWIDLLRSVYGVEAPEKIIEFEKPVKLGHTSFIDGYIANTSVLIEQKSIDVDLRKAYAQSDNQILTPFQQAHRYATSLPRSENPKWIIVCNFKSFLVYDMEKPNSEPEEILLENLEKEFYRLSFITDSGNVHLKREMELSVQAGKIVGELYDALLTQYHDHQNPSDQTLRSLNILCVRLVFCLYAEDAGIFGHKSMFADYLNHYEPEDLREALIKLFQVLDQDPQKNERDPYLKPELAAFPYVNGGLFTEEDKTIPFFTAEIKDLLINKASNDFNWAEISPTIFGAIFESTLNQETRRSGGMHYTSIENIHKVIDPLFMNDLTAEYENIAAIKQEKLRKEKAIGFQKKLGSLKFFDPACGSGNFLTESYVSLRKLENKCLRLRFEQNVLNVFDDAIFVNIHQFYGIEINDFAVSVAKTALWIAESQMMTETAKILQQNLDFLPLKTYANIKEGNALRIDWNEVVPKQELNYIMGNPPFVGARLMSAEQKEELLNVFGKEWKNAGNLDYVACWYKKACDYIKGTAIKAALVSTNSITQGDGVATLWKNLFADGVHIDFAHRTFRWDSESALKAHVHCVIVGFSASKENSKKTIYDGEVVKEAKNINAYLLDADDVFVESRNKPLCDVPEIGIGNKPIDGGNYLFTKDEMIEFIKREPASEKYFKLWYGSDEFINNRPRYCLWLGDCSPSELRKMPKCMERIENVRQLRLASKSEGTRKIAEKPTRFHVENMPKSNYIVIPETSSERRRYIPMGFLTPDNLCSNAVRLMPNATLYHFGILTSNIHNAWMRAVCGRLKSDYRYSKDIVYNNFPWCNPTDEQKAKIEKTAQAILDARAKFHDSSLADLYDETVMPSELRKAHRENDKAVMQVYGFSIKMTESECVAELFKMYEGLVKKEQK